MSTSFQHLERRTRRLVCAGALALASGLALAAPGDSAAIPPSPPTPAASSSVTALSTLPENWTIHGQITNVTQWHGHFKSPYQGTNSLRSDGRTEETTDITVYGGLKLWKGAELWLNPELDQGFGLDNTVGMAGFPSGEAYKIGANRAYLRLPRAFIRQTIDLGGTVDPVLPAANQLAGSRASDNLTITLGKFSPTDIFDTNGYAHDPRADLLNWSIIDAGAFDYAADAWGYTYGAAAEWSQSSWTARGGVFQLSRMPNGKVTGIDFSQFMLVGEFEQRYESAGQTGKVKILGFLNRGRMARYRDATAFGLAQGSAPDLEPVRRYSSRPGIALNLEHPFTSELGAFARAGVNDGSKEAYEFTEINKSVSGGLSLKGTRWGRADDRLAVAGVINGLSSAAREYFGAGGIGILIGDGALNYGTERIVEVSYSARLTPHLAITLDYQHVTNPAYNRDRGPVSIYGFRAHADF